ncbi:MAG: hypothetical protein H6669_07090 [Ardenticatenaceae bacterium]|nr:hypothetical protein [Ardenticatenaceae bacterium]
MVENERENGGREAGVIFAWLPVRLFFSLIVGLLVLSCRQEEPQPTELPVVALPSATAVSPYPVPTIQLTEPYPVVVATDVVGETAVPTLQNTPNPETASEIYLPAVVDTMPEGTATPTSIPMLDFAALQTQLQAEGQMLVYNKIGFHAGVNGTIEGLEEWMRQLDAAGVPFFIKTADNAEPVYIAQELMKQSGVPHTLVYRKASGGDIYNVPNYDLPPAEAAQIHWQLHTEAFPPELDPSLVWLETINEVDKNRSEWLAEFALETAKLALRDGYKWAAFGWASGEPEPEDWQSPAMLEFLRLAAANPDRIAIALHEYSYLVDDIGHEYPYKIGRFQELFRICDQYGIPRPTVLITEWGWTYEDVPEPEQALRDIDWAAHLYAPYPQVKGAAIWFLGGGNFSNIHVKTQRLIRPLTDYSLQHYFTALLPPNQEPIDAGRYQP